MIRLRREQIARLERTQREAFIAAVGKHLRCHFPDTLASLDDADLHGKIDRGIDAAAQYRLFSERDCCRYLGLAMLFGWDFDRRRDLAWVHAALLDPAVTMPAQRLHRLIDSVLNRSDVEAANRALRAQFDSAADGEDAGAQLNDATGMLIEEKR